MRHLKCFLLSLLLLGWSAGAQTSREELLSHIELTAANYANYPVPTGHLTPAPKGYEPFYISHYGRHGARYQTSDKAYKRLQQQLDTALSIGLLTEYGKDVRNRVILAATDARGRAGSLTKLGARQHKAIAKRMYDNYPSLMSRPLKVTASASTSRRVIHSMEYFCEELKELNPAYEITMAAREEDLYNVAADMYCLPELNLSFNDVFGEEGMINGFRSYNAAWCLWEGLMPGSKKNYYMIYPLLKNFLDEADDVISSGGQALRLRFGHDSVVLPFAFALGFQEAIGATDDMENLHKDFSIFRLIPMAANIQWVFYRKGSSKDILVKFLMNENETSIPVKTDCYPYYHWRDVQKYYRQMIKDANITYKTPSE